MENETYLPPEAIGEVVYVRPVLVDQLPDDVKAQVPDVTLLYAVHNSEGERLALVKDQALAFDLARQNEFSPVHVH